MPLTQRPVTDDDIDGLFGHILHYSGPDYVTSNAGKCLGPTTSKEPAKDGCKIFWTYIIESISNVLWTVSTETKIAYWLIKETISWALCRQRQVLQVAKHNRTSVFCLGGELSLSCARPAADGWSLMWVYRPLQVSRLDQLSLSSFRRQQMSSKQ